MNSDNIKEDSEKKIDEDVRKNVAPTVTDKMKKNYHISNIIYTTMVTCLSAYLIYKNFEISKTQNNTGSVFYCTVVAGIFLGIFLLNFIFIKAVCPNIDGEVQTVLVDTIVRQMKKQLFILGDQKNPIYVSYKTQELDKESKKINAKLNPTKKTDNKEENPNDNVLQKTILSLTEYMSLIIKYLLPHANVIHVLICCLLLFPEAFSVEKLSTIVKNIFPDQEIISKLVSNIEKGNINNSQDIQSGNLNLFDVTTILKFVNLGFALGFMLYNHCLSFARMSSLIRSILFIESFSLLTNSMIWIFIFIPTYKFTASYFSDLPNGIDKDLQTIFNEAVKNFKLEDVLNNLNQNPTVLLSVYIISFVSLYIVHTSIVLFIQDMIIKNVSDQMGLNLEIMKILKDQTISATQKYYIVSSMLLESQITLYRDKNLTQIEPLARTYPSMYNFKNDEEKKESVKKNEYLNVLYDWIGRILNSQYKYQFIGFIFLVIYIITKSFIFYIIMENKYLMEKVLLNFKSDEKYNTGIIIACGVFDLLHILIILIIGLIFSCKSKWKVRIKDKNYTQIINETEEDEIIIGIEESTEGSDEFKFTKTINRILNHFRKNDGFAALANIIDLTDQLSNLKVINELLKDTQIHPKASLFQIYDAIELKIDEENISFVFDDPVDKYFNFSKNIVKCNRLIKERNDIMENNIEMIKIYNVPIDKLKDSLNDTWNKSDDIKKKFPMKIKNDDKELRKKMTLMDTLFKKSDDEVKVTKNKNGKQSRNINTSIKHDEVTENMDGKHSSSINMTIKHDEVKENTTKQKGDEVRVKGEVKKEITKNKDGKQSINIQIKHNKIAEKSREDDKVVIKVINKKLNLHKNKLKKEIKKPKRSS